MNVVIDEAAEVYVKDAKPRRELGESHRLENDEVEPNAPLKVAYYSKVTTSP